MHARCFTVAFLDEEPKYTQEMSLSNIPLSRGSPSRFASTGRARRRLAVRVRRVGDRMSSVGPDLLQDKFLADDNAICLVHTSCRSDTLTAASVSFSTIDRRTRTSMGASATRNGRQTSFESANGLQGPTRTSPSNTHLRPQTLVGFIAMTSFQPCSLLQPSINAYFGGAPAARGGR